MVSKLKQDAYNYYPIQKVVASGIGGGKGPRQDRIGGVRPSFQSGDR